MASKTKLYLGEINSLVSSLSYLLDNEAAILEQAAAFKAERSLTYRGGRALLKAALLKDGLIGAGALIPTLSYNELGKPKMALDPYSFNLSHSHQLMALALGSHAMGVDVELCDTRRLRPALLKRVLSAQELQYFHALDNVTNTDSRGYSQSELMDKAVHSAQAAFFARQWTVRECLVKVMGKSIFTMDSIKLDLERCHIEAHDYPQGIIACFAIELRDLGIGNDKINHTTHSLCLISPSTAEDIGRGGTFGLANHFSFQIAVFLQFAYAKQQSLEQAVAEHLEIWMHQPQAASTGLNADFKSVKVTPQVVFTIN